MNDKSVINVPLQKVHAWKATCRACGGHVDVGSGGIRHVERITCPECKAVLSDDLLMLLDLIGSFCLNQNRVCDLSAVINLDRCEEE